MSKQFCWTLSLHTTKNKSNNGKVLDNKSTWLSLSSQWTVLLPHIYFFSSQSHILGIDSPLSYQHQTVLASPLMSSLFFVFPSVWETRGLRQKYDSWETRAKEQQFVLFSSVRDTFHVENLRRALTFPIWLCFLFISDTSQEFPSGVEWKGKERVWGEVRI